MFSGMKRSHYIDTTGRFFLEFPRNSLLNAKLQFLFLFCATLEQQNTTSKFNSTAHYLNSVGALCMLGFRINIAIVTTKHAFTSILFKKILA